MSCSTGLPSQSSHVRVGVLQSYYDRLKEIAEESEEELATPQRRRKSMSEAPAPASRSASAPDAMVAAGPAAGAEQPSAQPEPQCSDLAVALPAGAGVAKLHSAVQMAPTASQMQSQQPPPGKKGVARRSKAAAAAAPPAATKAADVAAPLAAAKPAASVHKQAAPEAEQVRELQAELQHMQHVVAEADSRHAADVKSISVQLEAARLAAAEAAQAAEAEGLNTARRLQAADAEVILSVAVQPSLLRPWWSCLLLCPTPAQRLRFLTAPQH
jgi:hypothetical protein